MYESYRRRARDPGEDPREFLKMIEEFEKLKGHRHPKFCKILKIHYKYLMRIRAAAVEDIHVMKTEMIDREMVHDILIFVIHYCFASKAKFVAAETLPNLYAMMGSDVKAANNVWDMTDDFWLAGPWRGYLMSFIWRKMEMIRGFPVELPAVIQAQRKLAMVQAQLSRADAFNTIWKHLRQLKLNGFSGTVVIIHREHILTDEWIQSLFGVFGRNNTVIEGVDYL